MKFPPQAELDAVCENEAFAWLNCLEPLSEKPKLHKVTFDNNCVQERNDFTTCVVSWRSKVGDAVENPIIKIKGELPGLPPIQCAPLSCLFQKCFKAAEYDLQLCKAFTMNFKYCTKMLFGSEYVD